MWPLSIVVLLSILSGAVSEDLHPPKEWPRYMKWKLGSAAFQPCPYANDPSTAVFKELSRTIIGQESAIRNITDEVHAWHQDHLNGKDRPLVLVFAGATGIGKTETAKSIARALLTGRIDLAGAIGKTRPEGELHLDGANFKVESPYPEDSEGTRTSTGTGRYAGLDLAAAQSKLRDEVAQLLYECRGNGVVILDESQKIPKSVLAPLRPLFRGEAAIISHPGAEGGQLSAARMVLIVISDTGMNETSSFITDVYGNAALLAAVASPGATAPRPKRMDLLQSALSSKMRALINREFEEGAFDLGQLADSVTAFMPIGQEAARALLHNWLLESRSHVAIRRYAHALTWTPSFVDMVTMPKYSKYNMYEPGSNSTVSRCHVELAAQIAARKLSYSSQGQAQAGSLGGMDQETEAGSKEASPAFAPSVCGEPCDLPRVCYLPGGARALRYHAEDAWKKLQNTLTRALKPVPYATKALIAAYGRHTPIMGSESAEKIVKRNDLFAKLERATGSVASLFTGNLDPAILEAMQEAAAKKQAAAAQEGEQSGLPAVGESVSAGTPAAARLHLDVSCAGYVPDGACTLRGVPIRVTRCLGRPELAKPAAYVYEDGTEVQQSSSSAAPAPAGHEQGEVAIEAVVDAATGGQAATEEGSDGQAPHPPSDNHESQHGKKMPAQFRPAEYAWTEQCEVIYEGDIV